MIKFFLRLMKRKIVVVAIVVFLISGGYWIYAKFFPSQDVAKYAVFKVRKGMLALSISGSGQVSASSQTDIKSKISGDAVYIGVNNNEEIKAGTLILKLDDRDAQKAIRDAEVNLDSANISLEKLKKPADKLSFIQTENALTQAQESKQKAAYDLQKSYDDGFNVTANAFLDLPSAISSLYDTLFGNDFNQSQSNIDYYADAVKNYDEKVIQYNKDAYISYQIARTAYDKNFSDYKTVSRYSDTATIEYLTNETYDTVKSIAEAIKDANNLIQFYKDKLVERGLKSDAKSDAALAGLNTNTGKTNNHLQNLLSSKNTIQNNKDALAASGRNLIEKAESLARLKLGSDELDVQSAELAVKQRQNALLDAREKLDDYFIRAPFDGVIAKFNVKKGDQAASSAVLAVIATKKKMAEISLNEIDAAKVKIGQKAVLTFDAIPGLIIGGEVADIDAVGTISQGVVTYSVKIFFETQDGRVKAGMSVSSEITVDKKDDAIIVPNSAVKIQKGENYVELANKESADSSEAFQNGIVSNIVPVRRNVKIGLIGDEFTEITNGLEEGEFVVTRTIQNTQASGNSSSRTQQNSAIRIPGFSSGGGVRTGGR